MLSGYKGAMELTNVSDPFVSIAMTGDLSTLVRSDNGALDDDGNLRSASMIV